ncbi:N-acetylmuramoyl-L-alanine amidase [Silvimonas terrae]|uniref:N-acetylmuramoyl-L-alanine amidase AmiC n=1 Tax=Silvimonas terrae TaxID=300266 RepID=A0A840RDF5_9NEIS|nr:N-acetylmuramoyl-L-alanine amidase [Silvimonas terrae]MBB5191007.1 N-acetylmuramoyl-L-alanine amidase [Silvimonas terrae]
MSRATRPYALTPDTGRRHALRAAVSTLFLSVVPAGFARAAAAASVVAVRVWPAQAYTRVTIESTTPLTFKQFVLKNPDRLVVDLEGVDLNDELQKLAGKVGSDDPYIQQLRAGLNKPGTVRLVLDLKTEVRPQVFTLVPVAEYKNRLVIDLYPAVQKDPLLAFLDGQTAPDGALDSQLKLDTNTSAASQPAQQTAPPDRSPNDDVMAQADTKPIDRSKLKVDRLITVVLDPGHGGEDPGATGPAGNHEKDVVLSIARKLKARLESDPNIRVVMTRDADFFVPLGVRVKKARAVQGDLFMSIHADAFIRPDANGSSVFVLSDKGATSTAAKWLAQTQNDADLIGGVKITNTQDKYLAHTLMDLTQTATLNDSMRFGRAMLTELGGLNRLHKGAVEQAGFAVLKAPDIPSILVETAFISNPQEEQRLISEDYQDKMADTLHTGIKKYFSKNPPLSRTKLAQS